MSSRRFQNIVTILFLLIISSMSSCSPSPSPMPASPLPAISTNVPTPILNNAQTIPTQTNFPEANPSPIIEPISPTIDQTVVPILSPAQITVTPPSSTGSALAFLKDADIWILDYPESKPYPLTLAGDILGFTWAPNGERLAAFNGHTLCFFHRDGSIRTACLDLGLSDSQAKIERRLVMSPDQRWIVLWNPVNPQDEGSIGWMIVALDTSNTMYRIQESSEWGADFSIDQETGGFTGQAIFLPDGRLIGTLSHESICDSTGCKYQLFEFDLETRKFARFLNEPDAEYKSGMRLNLSADGSKLINFGTDFENCDSFDSTVSIVDVVSQNRQEWVFHSDSLIDAAFDPTMNKAIIARSAGCANQEDQSWASKCGLSVDAEILPMQLWEPLTGDRKDIVPGMTPVWSGNGEWLAFQSCLSQDSQFNWSPDPNTIPKLFLFDPQDMMIQEIQDGYSPQWQP